MVVFVAVLLLRYFCLQRAAEDFEELVPEAGVEAFDIGVLPRAARLDEAGLEAFRFPGLSRGQDGREPSSLPASRSGGPASC